MSNITISQINRLKKIAKYLRIDVVNMLTEAGSGHLAGALGMADVFSVMYFYVLKHDPKKPNISSRDRLILSNGHICPIQYAALAKAGYFSKTKLSTLRKINSLLQGHPEKGKLAGIETTSGPLGEGLGQACGMALAAKMDGKKYYTYCIMSDGEQDEGSTWEAVMFASKNKLDNLVAIIDRNRIQIDGNTEDVMPLDSIYAKYQSFGWEVINIDGNDILEIIEALNSAKKNVGRPTCIVANTIASRGIISIEGDYRWHGKVPSKRQAEKFIQQIEEM